MPSVRYRSLCHKYKSPLASLACLPAFCTKAKPFGLWHFAQIPRCPAFCTICQNPSGFDILHKLPRVTARWHFAQMLKSFGFSHFAQIPSSLRNILSFSFFANPSDFLKFQRKNLASFSAPPRCFGWAAPSFCAKCRSSCLARARVVVPCSLGLLLAVRSKQPSVVTPARFARSCLFF